MPFLSSFLYAPSSFRVYKASFSYLSFSAPPLGICLCFHHYYITSLRSHHNHPVIPLPALAVLPIFPISCNLARPIPLPPSTSCQFSPTSCPSLSSSNFTLLLAALPFPHCTFIIPSISSTQPLAARQSNPIKHPNRILKGLPAAPAYLQILGHNNDNPKQIHCAHSGLQIYGIIVKLLLCNQVLVSMK